MARLAKCSRQKFFRPIIATFRAPLDFEPVIILSCLIPLFFIVRAQKILSLSLSVFLPSLSLFLFLRYIYIYIKPHDENLTDPRSSIYRCLLVPKSTRVILVGIYLHVKNHTFFNTRVSIDREKKPKLFITLYSISIHCTRFIVR